MSSRLTGDTARADLAKRAEAARLHASTRARTRAWKVVAVYASFAALWIYTSDRTLELVTQNAELLARISMIKGLLFVTVTSILLLLLLRPAFEHDEERWLAEATAASEKSFSETMIESLPGIVYFYDGHGRFLRWNRNFEAVSGYSAEEIALMHPLDFFDDEDKRLLEPKIAEAFEKGEAFAEAAFVTRDGRAIPYYFTARRVLFNDTPCLVGVGLDITERKQAEHALREMNETLEYRVVERTAELQAALVRAESADRLKSAFLATMSHELRTPLNSIIGFTGILQQGLAGPLSEEQLRQLGMVHGSARHLLDVINDVLDLSKIEAGQLEIRVEPFDLPETIVRVAGSVGALAAKKNLSVEVDIAPDVKTIVSDQRRVEQILINLLGNAIKFTDHGRIRLSADLLSRGEPGSDAGTDLRLRVADTGIGIRPEDLDVLFRPFQQLDTGLTRTHEGTGLGLVICRRLAALLGGEITVASEWTKGSEFTVTVPLVRVS